MSERDVEQLDSASTALASAAAAIRRANPSWGEAVIQALILANQVIERLRDRGAATFARHVARRLTERPQDAAEGTPATETTDQAPCAQPDHEES